MTFLEGADAAADLFISYSWTSDAHRVWVRQFAENLRAAGFQVLTDSALDYGEGLDSFMKDVAVNARHVLAVVDPAYVEKAERFPKSGVAIESRALLRAHGSRPSNWLSVAFKDNPDRLLPTWLAEINPKGFDFNADPQNEAFPGATQVEEVWRWLQGLPADKSRSVSLSTVRQRAARMERSAIENSQERWTAPQLEGTVEFPFSETRSLTFRIGFGEYAFPLRFSGGPPRLYSDPVAQIGLLARNGAVSIKTMEAALTSKRTVFVGEGARVVVQNNDGVLCLLEFGPNRREARDWGNDLEVVRFSWRIFTQEDGRDEGLGSTS